LVITHDAEIGARAERRIVMEDGRVVADDKP
jgi:predicted ABC-type transport system involved in lysophospholipase L1 biosynthesis ATPase subunit